MTPSDTMEASPQGRGWRWKIAGSQAHGVFSNRGLLSTSGVRTGSQGQPQFPRRICESLRQPWHGGFSWLVLEFLLWSVWLLRGALPAQREIFIESIYAYVYIYVYTDFYELYVILGRYIIIFPYDCFDILTVILPSVFGINFPSSSLVKALHSPFKSPYIPCYSSLLEHHS